MMKILVYPLASEECDGVRNDCVYDSSGIPTNEIDYDNDKYVECGLMAELGVHLLLLSVSIALRKMPIHIQMLHL